MTTVRVQSHCNFYGSHGTCIRANKIDLLRGSLIVTQLFRSHGTFSMAESGQAWRPSVLYAQNIGVARLGSGTRSLRSGWSLAKSVGEYFLRLLNINQVKTHLHHWVPTVPTCSLFGYWEEWDLLCD